jgi:hypothetical protein
MFLKVILIGLMLWPNLMNSSESNVSSFCKFKGPNILSIIFDYLKLNDLLNLRLVHTFFSSKLILKNNSNANENPQRSILKFNSKILHRMISNIFIPGMNWFGHYKLHKSYENEWNVKLENKTSLKHKV